MFSCPVLGRLDRASPSDETINRGPPSVYARKRITYARKRSRGPFQSSIGYGNTSATKCQTLKSAEDIIQRKKKKKKKKKTKSN